jgi:hypothetical protein
MESQELLFHINNLVAQKEEELLALKGLQELAINGYKTDQVRIDTEIQKGRDAVAIELADLTTQLDAEKANVIELTEQPSPIEIII